MTPLNTIIEEEKKEFMYKLNRLTPAGGFMLENGNYGHGMLSETFMIAFLTTAIQRAYEAGQVEERAKIREELEEHRKSDTYEGNESLVFQTTMKEVLAKLTPDKTPEEMPQMKGTLEALEKIKI